MMFKNDIEKFEFFESVLNNRISVAQKEEFEKALSRDNALSREFNEYQNLHELVIDNALLEMNDTLLSIHRDAMYDPGRGRGFSGNNILLTVISGIVIISATLFYLLRDQKPGVTKAEIIPEHTEQFTEPVFEQNMNIEDKRTIKPAEKVKNETSRSNTSTQEKQPYVKDTLTEENQEIPGSKSIEANLLESPVIDPVMEVPLESIDKSVNIARMADTKLEEGDSEGIDCENVEIILHFDSENSCVEETNSGKIKIDQNSIIGGTSPYYFSINGGKDYYESRYLFSYLGPGSYQLYVRDLNQCEEKIAEVIIEEDICVKDYKYSPALGEPWIIPVKKEKDGIFRMFSRTGQILVEKRVDAYSDNTWYGNDNNNYPLAMGYFPFIIQYSDGEVFEGSVTLVK